VSLQPQLSSASTVLQELTARISTLADEAAEDRREDVANALYEVERSLRTAQRRLAKAAGEARA
jgi:hypothetical protein